MFEDYYFTFTQGPYSNGLDQLNAQINLEAYLGTTELDIRAAVSEFVTYTIDLANQDPSNIDAATAVSLFNALTPNILTNFVFSTLDSQNLVNDYINSHPNFDLTTASLNQLLADASEAGRIGIGLELFRPQDLPPLAVDFTIPSFDFSFFQINPAFSFDSGFSTGLNFNFDFSSNFNFDFNFDFDFGPGDYWNFADYFGET